MREEILSPPSCGVAVAGGWVGSVKTIGSKRSRWGTPIFFYLQVRPGFALALLRRDGPETIFVCEYVRLLQPATQDATARPAWLFLATCPPSG
jgi:hypothetical protein